jgi:hypothetical protein
VRQPPTLRPAKRCRPGVTGVDAFIDWQTAATKEEVLELFHDFHPSAIAILE